MAGILLTAAAIGTKIIYHKSDPEAPQTKIEKEHQPAIMSSKLIPAKPEDVMVIRDITPNIVTLSVPFSRFGKLRVGGRGTIGKSPYINETSHQT
jgi:hypothetical protein